MKMIFVANNWADAHQQARLKALSKYLTPIVCLAFLREYYPPTSSFRPAWLGEMAHASYGGRWKIYLRFLKQLRKHTSPADTVYLYGFDLLVLIYLYSVLSGKRLRLLYEVPDIREMFLATTLAGTLVRYLEAWIIPRVDLLLVTSPEFVTEYFTRLRHIRVRHFHVIENKIHAQQLPPLSPIPTPAPPGPKIKIGYFGLLRCSASLDCLIALARKGTFDIQLRGIFMPSTRHYEQRLLGLENITYGGPYESPAELPLLYTGVDIVWAAYPYDPKPVGNHRWARTNRFYESLYFKKPMILQQNTSDYHTATRLGPIALGVDLSNNSQAAAYLTENLTASFLLTARRYLDQVPESSNQITDEYQTLLSWLQQKK